MKKRHLHVGVLLAMSFSALAAIEEGGPRRIEIDNGLIKLVLEKVDEGYREVYFARVGKSWKMMLESGSGSRMDPSVKCDGAAVLMKFREALPVRRSSRQVSLELKSSAGQSTLLKRITLRRGEPYARIVVSYQISGRTTLGFLLSTYSFVPDGKEFAAYRPLDFVFTPTLRPEPEQVIADHVFRSPALMVQKEGYFAALVPDVQSIDVKGRAIKSSGDLQMETAEKPFFSFGLQNWIPEPYRLRNTHVFYAAPDSLAPALHDTTVSYGFTLLLRADAVPHEGYREVVRYHWRESGAKNMQRAKNPQAEPFGNYIQKAWYLFLPQIELDGVYKGKPVTLLRQGRLAWSNRMHEGADNDCWFNVWFNSLRTAYGMYVYGRNVEDRKLMRGAARVLNLALLAPQKNGIAPSIFYQDSTGGHWVADQAWGGISHGEYLAMFHNAWTCYWLLQWIDLVPERRTEILNFTKAFADFLLAHQQKNGVVPSWYAPETLQPAEPLRDENAETAGAALFLCEFYKRRKEQKYLDAAERSMEYMFTNILPRQKWFDFETFFSCSRKPLGFFDRYTQQYPQNTLSMHQAAEACYELYQITKNAAYKRTGTEIMDYLCLYQQVWSPQWLSRELFGGFGVQNTDAEWSDARQGYIAVTLMNYYEMTGRREYFERGVAALRAMFSLFESPTSPRTAENYAHSGFDQPAGVTGIHWGTGSCVVSIELITGRYGDAFVDVKGQWGVGIDGCRIPAVEVRGRSMRLAILDNLSLSRSIMVKFGRLAQRAYDVRINGISYGKISADELTQGIKIAL